MKGEGDTTLRKVVDVVIRSQKSVGSTNYKFGGPDRYVAAVIRDATAEPVGGHPLTEANARKYGWDIRLCGEGYSQHAGPNSRLGLAKAKAQAIKAEVERGTA